LLFAVYFLPSFLDAVIGKGQLQNRHPKARHTLTFAFYTTVAEKLKKIWEAICGVKEFMQSLSNTIIHEGN